MRGSQSDPTHTYAPRMHLPAPACACTCLRLRYARVIRGYGPRLPRAGVGLWACVRLREYHALHHAGNLAICTVLVHEVAGDLTGL